MVKRYLVTGGAGFIGSHLARALIARGDEVVIVDNLSTGLRDNVPAQATFIEADLTRPETLDLLPQGPYAGVFHLAAQSSGAIGQKDPYADLQANVGTTMLLVRWCLAKGIARFLYASSMTVYGNNSADPVDEIAAGHPISYYGASKLASETYLEVARAEGLSPTSLRLYNVYGPGQNLGNRYQGMASIYLAYLLGGERLPVTGRFDRYRDLVYVDDVVGAFLAAEAIPATPSPAYNIGTGQRTTVAELIGLLIKLLNLPNDYPIDELPGSPADIFGAVSRVDRAHAELGWSACTSLEDGLGRMVRWALERVRL